MTTFPSKLAKRAAITIAQTQRAVNIAHQRLNTLGSQVSALTPGDWELLNLENGWSNVSGYIPAQSRILQNGMSQVIGHIQGGTVTSGTVIATLTAGYFNPVHAHAFTVNAVTGAQTAAQAGDLADLAGDLNDGTANITDGGVHCSPAAGTLASDSALSDVIAYCNAVGGLLNGGLSVNTTSNVAVTTGLTLHSGVTSTAVNLNTPTITLSTAGVLTIANVNADVTQLELNETLPLVTS